MNKLPEIPLEAWRPTKNTLHLYCQIVGKIRLAMHPHLNHWWHVPLYVTPRGLSTHTIPYADGNFEIEFDFCDHRLIMKTNSGRKEDFALYDGLTVADFYSSTFANLAKLGIEPQIRPTPYEAPSTTPFPEDTENRSYDKEYIARAHQTLVAVDQMLNEFRGRFVGKSTPVHMFWHSFDLALTRFSGRRVPVREGANRVEREAYSHEVISFGFWFGDDRVPAPAFYSYTAPEPEGLAEEPLSPPAAKWAESNGAHLAILMYEDARNTDAPRTTVLDFLESAYKAGAKRAGWDTDEFANN
ncbi:MAG TPA: DUF5996 family protein [Pyrinomonadaceae bacterium]|nr:DUF5996 family protein [Pyrinomonadaceae bacterium]HMP64522.1 DUF5996 family protein [Pyrinomonadaceae bacterium]